MQNVLNFPVQNVQKRKSLVERIRAFLKKREAAYQNKRQFLKDECYKIYLKRILKNQHNANVVDFPDFIYKERLSICSKALKLAELAIQKTESLYGRKHIEKCYAAKIKTQKKGGYQSPGRLNPVKG